MFFSRSDNLASNGKPLAPRVYHSMDSNFLSSQKRKKCHNSAVSFKVSLMKACMMRISFIFTTLCYSICCARDACMLFSYSLSVGFLNRIISGLYKSHLKPISTSCYHSEYLPKARFFSEFTCSQFSLTFAAASSTYSAILFHAWCPAVRC